MRARRMDDATAAAAVEPARTEAEKKYAAVVRQRAYQARKNAKAKIAEQRAAGHTGPASPCEKEKVSLASSGTRASKRKVSRKRSSGLEAAVGSKRSKKK